MSLEKPAYDKTAASRAALESAGASLAQLDMPEEKRRSGQALLDAVLPRLENDVALAEAVELIIQRDAAALREKDAALVRAMAEWRERRGDDGDFQARRERFVTWMTARGSAFVHASQEPIEGGELKSPRLLGRTMNLGAADTLLGHDRFVFGTWDALPHPLAQQDHQYRFTVPEGRSAYFTPMDVAEIFKRERARLEQDEAIVGALKLYANNLHTLGDMPDFMADYFATVFDDPEQAVSALTRAAEAGEDLLPPQARALHEELGLLPPLSVEVQVEGSIQSISL